MVNAIREVRIPNALLLLVLCMLGFMIVEPNRIELCRVPVCAQHAFDCNGVRYGYNSHVHGGGLDACICGDCACGGVTVCVVYVSVRSCET